MEFSVDTKIKGDAKIKGPAIINIWGTHLVALIYLFPPHHTPYSPPLFFWFINHAGKYYKWLKDARGHSIGIVSENSIMNGKMIT